LGKLLGIVGVSSSSGISFWVAHGAFVFFFFNGSFAIAQGSYIFAKAISSI
jgi:hypothetical protein